MQHSVLIEQISADGAPTGDKALRQFLTQDAAMKFTCRAIRLAQPVDGPMMFSVRNPDGKVVMTFTTKTDAVLDEPTDDTSGA